MKTTFLLPLLLAFHSSFSQISVGVKSDYTTYNVKSYLEREHNFKAPGWKDNSAVGYSVFATIPCKPLISFGAEAGGYQFSMDANRATNLFIKPSIIFNGTIGRNILAVDFGVYLEHVIKKEINNEFKTYEFTHGSASDTTYYKEKAFFQSGFAAPFIGASYTRMIGRIGVGIKIEASASIGGFYKGYESNFKRVGLFVKYTFKKK